MLNMAKNQFTKEKLKEMQSWDLDTKISVTLTKILEFANRFDNKVYVCFSGGKDSTVLLDLVRKVIPDVSVVFSNTGLEYPEIQAFARSKGAEFVRPKMMFNQVISQYGYPIISKEVSEAIYYARRIIKPSSEREREQSLCSTSNFSENSTPQTSRAIRETIQCSTINANGVVPKTRTKGFKETIRQRTRLLGLEFKDNSGEYG